MVLSLAACGGGSGGGGGASADAPTFEDLMGMSWAEIEEAAVAEGEVVFWTWHNEIGFRELVGHFEDRFGIDVDLVVSEKASGEMMAIAEAGGAAGSLDVMLIGGEFIVDAYHGGLLHGPIAPMMEAYNDLAPGLRARQEGVEHGGYAVPVYLNQTGLLINPNNVTERIQTWAELEAWIDANPSRFGFSIPSGGGTGQSFVLSVIDHAGVGLDAYYGDIELDEAKVEAWHDNVWPWFNDRLDRLAVTTSNIDSITRLNQGELDVVVAWNDQAYNQIAQGELFTHAEFYVPQFGMVGGGDTIGLLANAQNPAAGLLFINWITSYEGQTLMADILANFPANTRVDAPHTLLDPADFAYSTDWTPAVYKAQFIEDFTRFVMMG